MEEEEFNSLFAGEDEAFAVRAQFGSHLGALKDWIVLMGQLGMHVHTIIDDQRGGGDRLSHKEIVEILENIRDNIMNGLEALTGLLQKSAKELYGEFFPADSFVIPELDMQLGVGSLELTLDSDIAASINDLPEDMQDAAIRAIKTFLDDERMPQKLRDNIKKFLDERGK